MSLSKLSQEIIGVFEPGGKLSQSIKGFEPRLQQRDMVEAIVTAYEDSKDIVVEAGTGTGKTFAYLIPYMLMSKKMIVSTGTKNLQDQLMERDAAIINSLFRNRKYKVVCLKGKNNYLCLHNFYHIKHAVEENSPAFIYDVEFIELQKLIKNLDEFIQTPHNRGDLSKFAGSDNRLINQFRASNVCNQEKCRYYHQCFLTQARQAAYEADLLITNHTLLLLSAPSDRSFVSNYDVVIFDEAHKLPDYARKTFSIVISDSIIEECLGEFLTFVKMNAPELFDKKQQSIEFEELGNITRTCKALLEIIREMKKGIGDFVKESYQLISGQYADSSDGSKFQVNLRDLIDDQPVVQKIKGFLSLFEKKLNEMDQLFLVYAQTLTDKERDDIIFDTIQENAQTVLENFKNILLVEEDENARKNYLTVIDYRKGARGDIHFGLTQSMLDFSSVYEEKVNSRLPPRKVYTSATLLVNGSFYNFASQLAIDPEMTSFNAYSSPFNFQEQGCLYLPYVGLPASGDFEAVRARKVVELVKPLLGIIDGGFFILCTNISVMKNVFSMLLPVVGSRRHIYLQGQQSKLEIMKRVHEDGNAVVVATSSFWEGVDVKGRALSCVVIDRLPFPNKSDLLIQSLCDLSDEEKPNSSFMNVLMPNMLLALKQGVGRLIRSCSDYGVVLIADDRLNSNKSYINMVFRDLPDFPIARSLEQVKYFWQYAGGRFASESNREN